MHKKVFAGLLAILFACLAGCQAVTTGNTTQKETDTGSTAETRLPVNFQVQYIRTNGGYGEEYPIAKVIKSTIELEAYYNSNKNTYDLKRRKPPIASDSTIGFLDAIDKYNDAFFKNHILVLVLLEEPSGSNRHKVTGVYQSKDETEINILRLIPEAGTADMTEWHILIELKKADYNGTPITVNLDKQVEEMTSAAQNSN